MGGRGSSGGGGGGGNRGGTAVSTHGGKGGGGGGGKSGNKGQGSASTGGVQGGGKGGIGGTTPVSQQEKPKLWPNNLREKEDNRFDTLERQVDELAVVNPRWGDDGYNNNCQRCTAAFEMRQRGFEVTARSRAQGQNSGSVRDIAEMWKDADGSGGVWEWAPDKDTQEETVAAIEDSIAAWPDNARGFLYVNWADSESSHIMNVVKIDGQIFYADGQTGTFDPIDWKTRLDIRHYNGVMRVDHLSPSTQVGTWIKTRGDFEVNAPVFRVAVAETVRRGLASGSEERLAFMKGWQTVFQGKTPINPYSTDEADLPFWQLFEQGVIFARSPG